MKDQEKIDLYKFEQFLYDKQFHEFVEDLKNISLKFRGSSNQRIIDLQKSKKHGKIICVFE